MVFPISDDNSDRTTVPVVNYVLIGINILVFVVFQQFGTNERFTYTWSMVPEKIATGTNEPPLLKELEERYGPTPEIVPALYQTPGSVYLTLLSSMFLHGSILHLGGNMLFLWIFGDNVEDVLGHARYLIFYLVCGLLAALAHIMATFAFGQNSLIPTLGASGAISGVLGGYILLFPMRRVTVILFRFLTDVPAYVAIGIWFAFQLISGLGMLGGGGEGGVAYGAHIGGFLAGAALVKVFALGREPVTWQRQPREWE